MGIFDKTTPMEETGVRAESAPDFRLRDDMSAGDKAAHHPSTSYGSGAVKRHASSDAISDDLNSTASNDESGTMQKWKLPAGVR